MERSVFNKIVSIVKEMSAQGVPRKDIETNLRQMGLNDEEINDIIIEAKPTVNVAEVHEQAVETKEILESGDHLRPAIKKLDEHKNDIERVHTQLGEVHEKQVFTTEEIKQIREDLEQIRTDIEEIKPMIAATKRLNESLIKINKKMLTRLGGQ
ncbi:hypothetical protein K8R43_04115 [archaeon]|nr:hypothetical protein [archaeon]